jgi:hypothetical protein
MNIAEILLRTIGRLNHNVIYFCVTFGFHYDHLSLKFSRQILYKKKNDLKDADPADSSEKYLAKFHSKNISDICFD